MIYFSLHKKKLRQFHLPIALNSTCWFDFMLNIGEINFEGALKSLEFISNESIHFQ